MSNSIIFSYFDFKEIIKFYCLLPFNGLNPKPPLLQAPFSSFFLSDKTRTFYVRDSVRKVGSSQASIERLVQNLKGHLNARRQTIIVTSS